MPPAGWSDQNTNAGLGSSGGNTGVAQSNIGRMVRHVWTPAEIDLLDRAACSAMLERGPAAQGQVTGT